jgi:hypothetical protein
MVTSGGATRWKSGSTVVLVAGIMMPIRLRIAN